MIVCTTVPQKSYCGDDTRTVGAVVVLLKGCRGMRSSISSVADTLLLVYE